jgi:hypothetical protein
MFCVIHLGKQLKREFPWLMMLNYRRVVFFKYVLSFCHVFACSRMKVSLVDMVKGGGYGLVRPREKDAGSNQWNYENVGAAECTEMAMML